MNEVRQAWSLLRSPRNSLGGNSTWYDNPPPTIVHNRSFHEGEEKMARMNGENEQEYETFYQNAIEEQKVVKKRHSISVELTAKSSVLTDENGIPRITFSFISNGGGERQPENGKDQVYDVPKSPSRPASQLCDQDRQTSVEDLYEVTCPDNNEAGNEISVTTLKTSFSESAITNGDVSENHNTKTKIDLSEVRMRDSHHRLRAQKRRIGRAWNRVRSWLREEKIKLNDVVAKHAKLQNPAARLHEPSVGSRASYDLTKARAREVGSLTQVEEFGLSSVYVGADCGQVTLSRLSTRMGKKTISSDDILNDNCSSTLAPPTSISLDRLCVDDEERLGLGRKSATASIKSGLKKKSMLGSIRGLIASTYLVQNIDIDEGGQGGFEDVRKYVKQGGDLCKELASILHERSELEANYAKGLAKLSSKLTKACAKDQGGNSAGGVNEAWRCIGEEMEATAEAHRVWGVALGEQLAKPLRVGVAEAQARTRKSTENSVDKSLKVLQEWRGVTTKTKKHSFACARENERLQDIARIQSISQNQQNNKSANHHMTEKEANKLENRRRKAEDSTRRADTEFYTVSVRTERARLEYECTIRKGAKQMELLEEERLSALRDLANVYLAHLQALTPRLQQNAERLSTPIRNCNVSQDIEILRNLTRRIENSDTSGTEQLLPDFYAEHMTLAMNRERRKQALVRVLHLIRQDLNRERHGKDGLEALHRAFIKAPGFAADESTQNVVDQLHHKRSMLTYFEAARYKIGNALSEIEGGQRGKHPLAEYILVSRDKQGLQQSVLKIPSWTKSESFDFDSESQEELDSHLTKDESDPRDWVDRTAGDGNSENPPDEDDFSDFDEFSSNSEDNSHAQDDSSDKQEVVEQCRAMYPYSANLNDELSLSPGDLITVHEKQADGWWIGECRGRTGIFPATYVQVIH